MTRVAGKRLTTNVDELACFVRATRNIINMTQYEFADWLDVSRATILRLEKATSPLSYGVLVTIVHKLKQHGITSNAINDFLLGSITNLDMIDILVDWSKVQRLHTGE